MELPIKADAIILTLLFMCVSLWSGPFMPTQQQEQLAYLQGLAVIVH